MKQLKARLLDGSTIFSQTHRVYKRLQKHLDKQPVGFPATLSGVERRILREVFTVDEAELALDLDYKFQSFEAVYEKAKKKGISEADLQAMLGNMEKNGAIFVKIENGLKAYALHPFAVGIFEMKVPTMNANFYIDVRKYLYQGFAMEFLSTSHAQLRVIPVEKSITPDLNIATYDEVRELVLQSGDRISLADCVCRKGKDAIGRPCKETDRREICIGLGDFADMYSRNGFGRTISKEEAFEILAENEQQGLVLMPSNYLASNFICSCCKCCCGCLELVSMLAHPAEYVKNNYYAALNTEDCIGCGKCARTCKMKAIEMEGKKASSIDLKRCIGCGVCVAACKSGALYLKKKEIQTVPPKDLDALYDLILENKKGTMSRLLHMGKILIR